MAIDLSFFRGATAQMLREQGREQGYAEGLEQGRAEARRELGAIVLRVLRSRGVVLTTEQAELISACRDIDQLCEWLDRAALADSAGDVFGE
ncbi:hypothetical protein FEK35_17890 [Nocardia cyriacigeorgica]|uniref:DUF4351 domain-containing protein n=1 Tax=Nocardia cyriacigeorgica TaxID=135487 RepID=A0A5R8PBT5_9NOCA|nr:hypothetical protein [Nocardia cyriacigeorgica]TLG07849.1 hypothetical protein FEK35_17890 [Nocardia cyriacigeorgica]